MSQPQNKNDTKRKKETSNLQQILSLWFDKNPKQGKSGLVDNTWRDSVGPQGYLRRERDAPNNYLLSGPPFRPTGAPEDTSTSPVWGGSRRGPLRPPTGTFLRQKNRPKRNHLHGPLVRPSVVGERRVINGFIVPKGPLSREGTRRTLSTEEEDDTVDLLGPQKCGRQDEEGPRSRVGVRRTPQTESLVQSSRTDRHLDGDRWWLTLSAPFHPRTGSPPRKTSWGDCGGRGRETRLTASRQNSHYDRMRTLPKEDTPNSTPTKVRTKSL